jgi:hypothetical protein
VKFKFGTFFDGGAEENDKEIQSVQTWTSERDLKLLRSIHSRSIYTLIYLFIYSLDLSGTESTVTEANFWPIGPALDDS